MIEPAAGLWERARKSLKAARRDRRADDADLAASRACYACFYAVSAYFALLGRTFKKHPAVEIAVHRDLVRPGLWPSEIGERYSALMDLRNLGDYGQVEHVQPKAAADAVEAARILRHVHELNPAAFPDPESD